MSSVLFNRCNVVQGTEDNVEVNRFSSDDVNIGESSQCRSCELDSLPSETVVFAEDVKESSCFCLVPVIHAASGSDFSFVPGHL